MHLENIVWDARDPQLLARFWAAALGADPFDGECSRLHLGGGAWLDLCFQPGPDAPTDDQRLHLDLLGGTRQAEIVEELLALGATHADIGQGDVAWVVLADPEGNPFCVMPERTAYTDTGPIAALPLDSADPARDAEFWSWLTGWVEDPFGSGTLRHPSRRGPLLALCPEPAPTSAAKNRIHLDVRLEPGDDADAVAAGISERGGRPLEADWGDLPWRSYLDPSGNELCVLPPPG